MGPVAGGVGILSLVARMVACNIIVFGSVPCCADVGAGADAGADADADDGDGDGDAFRTSVDGKCAVHVSVFDADTDSSRSMPMPVPVLMPMMPMAMAMPQDQCRWLMCCARANTLSVADGGADTFSTNVDGECAVHVSGFDADTGPVEVDACLQYQCRWRMCCARVWI